MCEQCLVNPLYFGEVLPGWYLIRARRDGDIMKVGDWGMIQCNDPTIHQVKIEIMQMSDIKQKLENYLNENIHVNLYKSIDNETFTPVIKFEINGAFNVELTQDAKFNDVNIMEIFGDVIMTKIKEGIKNSNTTSF